MKNVTMMILLLLWVFLSDASITAISEEGDDVTFGTSDGTLMWTFSPDDTCYYEAFQFNRCATLLQDMDTCFECAEAGNSNPKEMTCSDLDIDAMGTCIENNSLGDNGCNDKAVDFFNCIIERDYYSACSEERSAFDLCFETGDDASACAECAFAGQPDPDNFQCASLDCSAIGECQDTNCGVCEDELVVFSNCAFIEGCDSRCIYPTDACYDQISKANECAGLPLDINTCYKCYIAGQPDPENITCAGTDCAAYVECLEDYCEDYIDEYMQVFACKMKKPSAMWIVLTTPTAGLKIAAAPHVYRYTKRSIEWPGVAVARMSAVLEGKPH